MKIKFLTFVFALFSIHAFAASDQRELDLKSHTTAPKTFSEARIYYESEDGYGIANSPKITPDKGLYSVFGKIELSPSSNSFIARFYFDGMDSPDPRTRQITYESMRLFGRTNLPYFQVRVPNELIKQYNNSARMNSVINVIGVYSGNSEIMMASKQRVQIPVIDALFLQFQDNGPIAMIPLKQAAPKATIATQQGAGSANVMLAKYKPSFDCAKASSTVEKFICSSQDLGRMDGLLSATYKLRLDPEFGADPSIMKANQRNWMGKRNQCATLECVKTSYLDRIKELCSMPVTSGVHWDSDCDVLIDD
ncbi:hypothetical protein [Limnohabitans sp.]|uniref:lysozyme inhibitor LprI family protein n=1 Tax=Limnohabitans sp. TaxID=1907725 RepID=UPI00286EED5F|nr:hypothetical protein [Limnohabitans sp.]